MHSSNILPAVVVGMIYGAIFPVALGMSVCPVHPSLVQEIASDIAHDSGFAPDPNAAIALGKRELPRRLLKLSADPSDRSVVVQPCHLEPR
jgi:hypothetical protein